MQSEWTTARVAECLAPLSLGGKTKIQGRDYKTAGRFPIIDQGQDQIAGWTDDDAAVIFEPLPLIIFGDHTRALKLIDVPFARGADGTQVLRPVDAIDPRFFFYACRYLHLPSRGYNRHFSMLKEKEVAFPLDKDEQTAIAAVLERAELATSSQADVINVLHEIKRATMRNLFTGGRQLEEQTPIAAGPVRGNWDTSSLGAHHSVVSGGTPSRATPEFWNGGTIPWVKTTEVDYCVITETEEHITDEGLAHSAAKMLPMGTVLMAMYGQGVTRGKVAILGIEAACNQACAAIVPTDDAILPRYLYHFLSWQYEAIRTLAHGGQQQNLNLDIVRDLPVAYPTTLDEQGDIVRVLDTIDDCIQVCSRKRDVHNQLFNALLQQLMSRDVDVSQLNLAAIAPQVEVAR